MKMEGLSKRSCFLVLIILSTEICVASGDTLNIDYLGYPYQLPYQKKSIDIQRIRYSENGLYYLDSMFSGTSERSLVKGLTKIKNEEKLDDWFFYQLIRRTAEQIIPKKESYLGYTYCKWMLLKQTDYAPLLRLSPTKVLLYVKSNDSVNNIPYLIRNGQQYVCLNYHDYGYHIDFEKEDFQLREDPSGNSQKPFSYQITQVPEFSTVCYSPKKISFSYKGAEEEFIIPVNPQLLTYFNNYPVIDFRYQFSIPFSSPTYASLIPQLKKRLLQVPTSEGVEYLMYFVRNAFQFQRDSEKFGLEKRFSPEETLVAEKSDCEDRSALFFALVKELYALPMIVISYPEHVTVAVQLSQPIGQGIQYNGTPYTLCEPTPQKKDLGLGELMPQLKGQPYEVVLKYDSRKKEIQSTSHDK